MARAYFLHQIKHKKDGTWDKGIVVKDGGETDAENLASARQSYHDYLGAYGYGHDADTDYVACYITNEDAACELLEKWDGRPKPEPTPEPTPEPETEAANE